MFKKYSFIRSMWFFESENLAVHEPRALAKIRRFSGIGHIQIYLIGTMPVFENRKTLLYHSTLMNKGQEQRIFMYKKWTAAAFICFLPWKARSFKENGNRAPGGSIEQ